MKTLKNCRIFDVYGRRLENDEGSHFVVAVGEGETSIICSFGILFEGKLKVSNDYVYQIESFAEMPEIEKNLEEKGCLFCCALKPNDPEHTCMSWPELIKYKAEHKDVDTAVSIACSVTEENSAKYKVELLQIKLADINDAGFRVSDTFYRVGVMEKENSV